jgi:hypothetical protein
MAGLTDNVCTVAIATPTRDRFVTNNGCTAQNPPEEWLAPIDTRMEALGGTVVRERREDFVDDLIERRTDAARAELAQWESELAGDEAKRMESNLDSKLVKAQEKRQRTAEKARARLDQTK